MYQQLVALAVKKKRFGEIQLLESRDRRMLLVILVPWHFAFCKSILAMNRRSIHALSLAGWLRFTKVSGMMAPRAP